MRSGPIQIDPMSPPGKAEAILMAGVLAWPYMGPLNYPVKQVCDGTRLAQGMAIHGLSRQGNCSAMVDDSAPSLGLDPFVASAVVVSVIPAPPRIEHKNLADWSVPQSQSLHSSHSDYPHPCLRFVHHPRLSDRSLNSGHCQSHSPGVKT